MRSTKRFWLGPVLALTLAGAQAHDSHPQDANAVPGKPVAPMAKPKRDAQAYFTDRELVTQDGRKVRFYSDLLKGRTVVLSTMYTSCEDACPLITAQLTQVAAKLGASFGRDVHFVAITSDPERDTPQALKAYAGKHSADGPGWTFVTGSKPNVEYLLRKLGQWSGNIESHSTQIIAWNFVTDRGRKMLPNVQPELIAAQIEMLSSGDLAIPLPAIALPRSSD